jgi:hypothetical protein
MDAFAVERTQPAVTPLSKGAMELTVRVT